MEYVLKQASSLYDLHSRINAYLKHKTMRIQNWFASVYHQDIFPTEFDSLNVLVTQHVNNCDVIFCWFV